MNKKSINIIALIVYKFLLEIIYFYFIIPVFGYSGFLNRIDISSYFLFWIIYVLFIPQILALYKKETVSQAILLIFLLVNFVPSLVLFSFMPQPLLFIVLFICYWIAMIIFNNIVPIILPPHIKGELGNKLILVIVMAFTLFILFLSGKYTNFRLNFDLLNVYSLRDEVKDLNLPLIFVYLFSSAKVVLPIISIYFYSIKRKAWAFFLIFLQFLAFSIDGSKSTLFSIVITYIIYFAFKKIYMYTFTFSILCITFLSIIEPLIGGSINIITFFIRRAMFVPSLLNIYYFDFFRFNEKDFFRQGIIGRVGINSPYSESIPQIIGKQYLGSENLLANNGLFSDAYSNIGLLGIIFLPLSIIIMLKLLDGCCRGLQFKILIATIITSAYTFISSSFFTVLLTHGFLIVCIVIWLIPKNQIGDKNE
ncbi:TPA: oligosaccharide repeat unit polymerase [Enterococcus faecium]|uniref:O-antigen polymerase n=1 Tax=Enterococcus faecium TaxID=1352 RepID=UPI0002A3CBD7|nr:O-antigen polymerase [Enterococcus faecium]ELB81874.1 hypothetical protein OMC_04891 [Enterococcus faecium EnGen0049]ELB84241.1 hypothetical protein OMA_03634 [Enterococcus faecium EnGen0045]MBW4138185.1 oligosaccharide repeat unit polymerase [Enterococcus faecium]MWG21414.1 hypothetical protein [Enterococcus faecium]NTR92188.1 oligosaccharide repeat unit polymerase [Enterococcus faecium]